MLSSIRQLDLFQAFRRFTVSSVMAVVTTLLAIKLISADGDIDSDMAVLVSFMVVGYFLFLGGIISRLIRESRQNATSELVSLGVCGVLAIIIFLLLPQDYDLLNTKLFRFPFYFFGIAAIMHLVIAYVPFITKGSDGDFWEYNRKVFIRIVESGFFSGVLFLAVLLALVAIDKLFGIEFDGRIYGYVAVSIFGIFNSIYFLSKFPELDYDDNVERPLSAFLVFTQFLLIPITIIYMIILYAYGVKIVLDGELPRGWIGNLSLWFSVIGVFTYLLNYLNPRFSNRQFVRHFIRYFFIVLIVPAILLMISIYRRIGDYGITEERYVLTMVASWLTLIIVLYGILRWRSLKWVPITLSAVVAFGLLSGPMSIFGATLSSQKDRLHEMMMSGGLIGGGVIDVELTQSDITDQLRYLDERSDLSFINDWVSAPLQFRDEYVKQDTSNAQIVALHFNLKDGYYSFPNNDYISITSEGEFLQSVEEYRELLYFDIMDDNMKRSMDAAEIIDGQLYVKYDGVSYPTILRDSIAVWHNSDDSFNEPPYRLPVNISPYSGDLYFLRLEGEQIGLDSIYMRYAQGFLLIR